MSVRSPAACGTHRFPMAAGDPGHRHRPGEWVTERDRLRFGFETEGVRIEPGEPAGYEEGTLGWEVAELQRRWSSA